MEKRTRSQDGNTGKIGDPVFLAVQVDRLLSLASKCRRFLMNKCKRVFYILGVILGMAVIMVMVTTACSVVNKWPFEKFDTGPTRNVELQVPFPTGSANPVELKIEFVAGELFLSPGRGDYLISGTASFNAVEFEPRIESADASISLNQGDLKAVDFQGCPENVENQWNMELANVPLKLTINAGAYDGDFELGGLSLVSLDISDGGSDVTCTFSTPNQVVMSSLHYSTGASTTKLVGLANANFETMTFSSGAGDFTLSFDGELQRDAAVTVDSGLGTVTIIVPQGVNAQITLEEGLSTINTGNGWVQNENIYTHSGSGPTISIALKMGAGTLNLESY